MTILSCARWRITRKITTLDMSRFNKSSFNSFVPMAIYLCKWSQNCCVFLAHVSRNTTTGLIPMKLTLCLACLFQFFSGCTSSFTVWANRTDNSLTWEQATENLHNKTVSLLLDHGELVIGSNVHIRRDSTSWLDPATGESHSVPTRIVHKISTNNHLEGAWDGVRTGLLSDAFVIGIGLGVLGRNDLAIGFIAEGTAVLMVTGGLIYGGFKGHTDEYYIYADGVK